MGLPHHLITRFPIKRYRFFSGMKNNMRFNNAFRASNRAVTKGLFPINFIHR